MIGPVLFGASVFVVAVVLVILLAALAEAGINRLHARRERRRRLSSFDTVMNRYYPARTIPPMRVIQGGRR